MRAFLHKDQKIRRGYKKMVLWGAKAITLLQYFGCRQFASKRLLKKTNQNNEHNSFYSEFTIGLQSRKSAMRRVSETVNACHLTCRSQCVAWLTANIEIFNSAMIHNN